ncbi:MAG: hypothetical protein IPP71_10755 [Bacteroidetes bacterium]|nr:hypothetical protein [Bacteroidota bacterium]
MTMTKFKTLQELRLERQKLYLKKELLEDEIKMDFEEFRESLRPINMIKELFHPNEESGQEKSISPLALSIGSAGLDLIIGKLVLGKSSLVKKLLSSYVIRAVGPSLITKAAPLVSGLFKELYEKFSNKNHNHQPFERSTASEQY